VFNKIREKLGGRVWRVATGSAPISNEVMIFAKAALGCPIPEGYGQTEATCSITFSHPFDPVLGHCGAPVSCYMVKLVDVPEMGYFASNNQGEVIYIILIEPLLFFTYLMCFKLRFALKAPADSEAISKTRKKPLK
jgi:long-subunit acyl-CoA synthetase (AMP-forming)